MKMVIVATHPIQHFCPQYRSLAALPGVDLTVVFGSMKGVEAYHDAGFGAEVSWGGGLLEGFEHVTVRDGEKVGTTLDRLAPDWLVVYGYASPIARSTWAWALRHLKTKLAYIADSELRHGTPASSARTKAKTAALSAMFRRVNAFLTVGDANEDYYRAHRVKPSKFVRMHFPIDPALDFSSEAAEQRRAEHGIEPGALVVLNVGKFEGRKRQADLIEACRDLPGVHLVLAGSGAEEERCRAAAAGMGNVTFLGFQQPRDLATFYALADVYVHPSTFDPHPLAVSEAAAAGCVSVVSDATGSWGPTDDVIPEQSGFVFPVGDVNALRKILVLLEGDRPQVRSMGDRAQAASRGYQARAHGGFLADLD